MAAVLAAGAGQRVLDAVGEQRAVGQVGDRVVERLVGELLLERLALADVAAVEHDAAHVLVVEQVGVQRPRTGASRRRGGGAQHSIDRRRRRGCSPPARAACDSRAWSLGVQQVANGCSMTSSARVARARARSTGSGRAIDAAGVDDGDQVAGVRAPASGNGPRSRGGAGPRSARRPRGPATPGAPSACSAADRVAARHRVPATTQQPPRPSRARSAGATCAPVGRAARVEQQRAEA